jgi:hypothetical protein
MADLTNYFVDPSGGDDGTGTGAIGAPWQTVQHALDNIVQNATDGDRVNVKDSADDVLSGALNLGSYGSPALGAPLMFQGYTTTQGDGGIGGLDRNGGGAMYSSTAIDGFHFVDMHLHNPGAGNTLFTLDNWHRFYNCEIEGPGATGINGDDAITAVNCYFHNFSNTGFYCHKGAVHGSYFEDIDINAIWIAAKTGQEDIVVTHSIFNLDGTGRGILCDIDGAGFGTICNNSFFSTGTGTALQCNDTGMGYYDSISNNLFEGWGIGIDWNVPVAGQTTFVGNAFYDCTDEQLDEGDMAFRGHDNESLGATPFAKSGAATWANRGTYFAPADTGNVLSPSWLMHGAGAKGAVQPTAGGNGDTTTTPVIVRPTYFY